MKVLRWQEASLKSSKGFYRASRSFLKSLRHPHPEIHEHPSKSMKIYENLWKSIGNGESPQMTRIQPGIEQRFLQGQQVVLYHPGTLRHEFHEDPKEFIKIIETPWKRWKSLKPVKIFEIRWKSWEDKKPSWNRAKFSIGTADRYLVLKQPCPEIHANPYDCMKIMNPLICLQTPEHLWTSLKLHEHLRRFMKILANLWNHEKPW